METNIFFIVKGTSMMDLTDTFHKHLTKQSNHIWGYILSLLALVIPVDYYVLSICKDFMKSPRKTSSEERIQAPYMYKQLLDIYQWLCVTNEPASLNY